MGDERQISLQLSRARLSIRATAGQDGAWEANHLSGPIKRESILITRLLCSQSGCTTAYKRRAFTISCSTCKYSISVITRPRRRLTSPSREQGDGRRAVRGHCGARVLQRGGRVALHPADLGERESLPPEWSRAQGSQGESCCAPLPPSSIPRIANEDGWLSLRSSLSFLRIIRSRRVDALANDFGNCIRRKVCSSHPSRRWSVVFFFSKSEISQRSQFHDVQTRKSRRLRYTIVNIKYLSTQSVAQ